MDERRWILANEFAEVAVSLDLAANGPRLRLEDLRSGRVRYASPLDLECFVHGPAGHLETLLDPAVRWSEAHLDQRPSPEKERPW